MGRLLCCQACGEQRLIHSRFPFRPQRYGSFPQYQQFICLYLQITIYSVHYKYGRLLFYAMKNKLIGQISCTCGTAAAGNFSCLIPGRPVLYTKSVCIRKAAHSIINRIPIQFMYRDKWYGCIGGLIVGCVLPYMGTQYTGQIIEGGAL